MNEEAGFILLAAGLSTRFGHNKLLACADGEQPLILQTAKNILATSDKLLIVSNINDHAVNTLLDKEGIPHLSTPLSKLGMGHSLAFGVQQRANWPGWIICLADMPIIKTSTYQSVQQAIKHHQLVVPCHNGYRGKPVGFSSLFYKQLTQLQGDQGARSILHNKPKQVFQLNCNDPGILLDADTPEQLEKLKSLQ
jgi:molybdenum cofactor cytidylyltransferase